MKRIIVLLAAMLLAIGIIATAAIAQGQGHGPPDHSAVGSSDGLAVILGETEDHGAPSGLYEEATVVDTVTLPEGDWKITGTGAINFSGEVAPNCGLLTADKQTLIAKQNLASEDDDDVISRGAYAVVGGLSVDEGNNVDVQLVCYGGTSFEHNLVAVGGN